MLEIIDWLILPILFLITLASGFINFIYVRKLVFYLEKKKINLFNELILKRKDFLIPIFEKLPPQMRLNPKTWFKYIFLKNPYDDNISLKYKRGYAVSLIICLSGFILIFLTNFLWGL